MGIQKTLELGKFPVISEVFLTLESKGTAKLHNPSLSPVVPPGCGSATSPVGPSHGTGTVLLCGSPVGPGPDTRPWPCCSVAGREKRAQLWHKKDRVLAE